MTKTATILRVERTVFAFNLVWATPAEAAGLKSEAEAAAAALAAEAPDRKVLTVRLTAAPEQYALCWQPEGARPALLRPWFSAAATLASAYPVPLLGVWPVGDGRCWLLAVGHHGILPDGDRILADEDEAYHAFSELLPRERWARVYAPPAWKITDGRVDGLDALLSVDPAGRVRPAGGAGGFGMTWSVPAGGASKALPVAAFFATVVGGGAYLYLFDDATPVQVPAIVQQVMPAPSAPPPPKPPAEVRELAGSMLACWTQIDTEIRTAGRRGWWIEAVTCGGDQLAYHYAKETGAPEVVTSASLPQNPRVVAFIAPAPTERGPLPQRQDVTTALRRVEHELREKIEVADAPDAPPRLLWKLATKAPRPVIRSLLGGLPQTDFVRMSTRFRGDRLTIVEGASYVEP